VTLPPPLVRAVAGILGAAVRSSRPVGGGSINHAARVELADGRIAFVKHHPQAAPGGFASEAPARWRRAPPPSAGTPTT
jgi:hypothetical protein